MVQSIVYILTKRPGDVSVGSTINKILESTSPIDSCVSDWQDGIIRVLSAMVFAKSIRIMLQQASLDHSILDNFIKRLNGHLIEEEDIDENKKQGALLTLNACLRFSEGAEFIAKSGIDLRKIFENAARDENPSIRAIACNSAGWALIHKRFFPQHGLFQTFLKQALEDDADALVRTMAHTSLNKNEEDSSTDVALDNMPNELSSFL